MWERFLPESEGLFHSSLNWCNEYSTRLFQVKLISPSPAPLQVVDEGAERKEGALINAQTHNLEYSVEIGAQDKKEFTVKYQIDFPQGEKLDYQEKF